VDPLADSAYSWTPYNYVLNNPLIHIDPNGEDPFVVGKNGKYHFINTDKVSDQVSVWGGFLPFGSLARPIAAWMNNMSSISKSDKEAAMQTGTLMANTTLDAAGLLDVGKSLKNIFAAAGAALNVYGVIDYYSNENWEVDEIVGNEFRIGGTTKNEVVGEYLGARTLINTLIESGDISYEYKKISGVKVLQYDMTDKARKLVNDLDYMYFQDNLNDFE
jgi:hypothetical protein